MDEAPAAIHLVGARFKGNLHSIAKYLYPKLPLDGVIRLQFLCQETSSP